MESSSLPKIRYVRCPKCREILPEPDNVPFYKCGGCETILQAKHYKKPIEREMVSEASNNIQNNKVENIAQGGEASSSNPLPLTDSKEGINAEDGNLEQAVPSSAQRFQQRDEESEQNIQVTGCLREDSSSNEPSSPSHDVPSNLAPETGELEGDHRCVEQREDSIASSSDESMEQLAQLVEEQLEAEDSRTEAASSEAITAKTDGEGDDLNKSATMNCRLEQPGVTDFTLLSNEPSLNESSNCSSQVVAEEGSCTEVKNQPEQIELILSNEPTVNEEVLKIEQHVVADGYCNTPASPNKSTFHKNKELPQLVTENQDIVEGGTQNEIATRNEDSLDISVLPELGKTSGSINSLKSETLTALDEYKNSESQNSVKVDATAEEVLTLDGRSQKTAEINPIEEIKVTETVEVADAHFNSGISCRDLPKSPTRKSFAYDGSVSSCEGNDDQTVHQILSETIQGIDRTKNPAAEDRNQFLSERSMTSSGSTFQPKKIKPHSEEQIIPVMLNEIKMPEIMSDAPSRRSRVRPRMRKYPSRAPVYKGSQEIQYDHLPHRELYDHPMYYPPPPYQYRDVESRVTRGHLRRSDVDGRMISEAVWMGEEFHHMYPESSGEIYPYPMHHIPYHGRRQTEYQPLVHSGYRVVDSYSHLHPKRGRYGPFESYYTDSDYYAKSHETFSGDQRHTNERRMSRLQSRRNAEAVQHLKPIGGAAPFITCYQCSELLQLPCDFLVIKGIRVHRLKCSGCSSVLKFTLERSFHLVSYMPNKSLSTSHTRSASASISAAGKVSLRSLSQAPERPKSEQLLHDKGKSVMLHSHNNTAGSSCSPDMVPKNAKVTWRLPDRNNCPLHRLMGYSSPSAVLYGYGSDDFETHSQSRRASTDFTPQSDNT